MDFFRLDDRGKPEQPAVLLFGPGTWLASARLALAPGGTCGGNFVVATKESDPHAILTAASAATLIVVWLDHTSFLTGKLWITLGMIVGLYGPKVVVGGTPEDCGPVSDVCPLFAELDTLLAVAAGRLRETRTKDPKWTP